MGLFDKLLGKESNEDISIQAETGVVYSPMSGKIIPIKEIGDGVFSEEILGPGCGIEPNEEVVIAPFDGTISTVAETKHAIGITSNEGVELLIHVGMDTVSMNGDGFTVKVQVGQKVHAGQSLLSFSLEKIKTAGHPTVAAIVFTNSDEISINEPFVLGDVKKGNPVARVEKNI